MGFTLIFYLNRFINISYAETITVGAYIAVALGGLGLGFYISLLPAALLAGCFSVLTYVLLYRPAIVRGVQPTEMIILSVGVSFMIRYGLALLTGAKVFYLAEPDVQYFSFLGLGATSLQIAALVIVAFIAAGLIWMIYRSSLGEQMRGLANNQTLAVASGINPHKTSIAIWFVAGVAGGLAGTFLGVFSNVTPQIGWNLILIIVMVTIVGGVGSVKGAILASILAGTVTAFITLVAQPLYAEVVLLVAFIIVLGIRRGKAA